jgi:hypothetical protein
MKANGKNEEGTRLETNSTGKRHSYNDQKPVGNQEPDGNQTKRP